MVDNSLAGARVADAVLTDTARGYSSEAHVWQYLFPVVEAPARSGKIVEFTAESMREYANLIRAPGADRQRIRIGYGSNTYALIQRALDGEVPLEQLEEAMAVPGVVMSRVAVATAMGIVSTQIEIEAATKATTAANYAAPHTAALAGNAKWSHDESDPADVVGDICETIASNVGMWPNTIVVGPKVHKKLIRHPEIVDRVKHTSGLDKPQVNETALANYFDLEHYIPARSRKLVGEGDDATFESIWGNNVIVAVVGKSSIKDAEAQMGIPSYGYTYRLRGYPVVRPGWLDQSKDCWRYPVTCEDEVQVTGKDAGYLLREVV